ncbi:MAG TPA: hypothetical protein DF480_07265 [Clostridiales bacterium]|nr:hypothetical protein [Clostridiales bacterium]
MSDKASGVMIAAKAILYVSYILFRLVLMPFSWFFGGFARFGAGFAVGTIHGFEKLMKKI